MGEWGKLQMEGLMEWQKTRRRDVHDTVCICRRAA
jgi:hypothetical protein